MIFSLCLILTGCVGQIVVTEYENLEPVRSIEIQMMSDYVAMPVDAMPHSKGKISSGYPALNPVPLRTDTYRARELYYRVIEEYPDLEIRMIVVGMPDTIFEPDFICEDGNAYIRDDVVYVQLAD